MQPVNVDAKYAEIEMSGIAQASLLGEDAIITPERLATILECSVREVAKLRKAGRLPPAVRLGRLVRWRLADIRLWVWGGCKG